MMKKSYLILLTLVPIVVGWSINAMIGLPFVGMLMFYVLPFAVLLFWYWLGGKFAETDWGATPAILIGSASGLVSLAVYLWQFLGRTDETRHMILAVFSQMYTASTPMYLFGGVARLFEKQPNYAGRTTMVALQVLCVLLMVAVFSIGYFRRKKRR